MESFSRGVVAGGEHRMTHKHGLPTWRLAVVWGRMTEQVAGWRERARGPSRVPTVTSGR